MVDSAAATDLLGGNVKDEQQKAGGQTSRFTESNPRPVCARTGWTRLAFFEALQGWDVMSAIVRVQDVQRGTSSSPTNLLFFTKI